MVRIIDIENGARLCSPHLSQPNIEIQLCAIVVYVMEHRNTHSADPFYQILKYCMPCVDYPQLREFLVSK